MEPLPTIRVGGRTADPAAHPGRGNGRRSLTRWLIPVGGAILLTYLVIFPLLNLLQGSFQVRTGPQQYEFSLENYSQAYSSRFTYSTFVTSLVFAVGSALVAFLIGSALAWLVERTNVPFGKILLPVAVVPLILPGLLESLSWIFLLSPSFGYINVLLTNLFGLETAPLDIYSLWGMIWVQGLGSVPLAFLLMTASFKLMDPSLEESAAMSGASRWGTFRDVTVPLLRPWIASVVLLLLVRSLEAFEVPAIIGFPAGKYVYTSEIYLAFNDVPPNYGLGSALAVGLLVLSSLGVWLYLRAARHTDRYATVSGKAFRPNRIDLGRWKWPAFAAISVYAVVGVLAPFAVIVWASFLPFFARPDSESLGLLTLDNYRYLFDYEPFYKALTNSIVLAVLAATLVMLLTAVIAWLLYKSKMRGVAPLEFLAMVPIAVPGLVLGMGLVVQYVAFPLPIYGTIWVLLIAYVTKYLPYGMRSASGSILQIKDELEEAAGMSGANWGQTFRTVTLPLLRPGLAAGWIYIAIVSFREFSTSVLLASGDSTVLSIQVFRLLDLGQANTVAALGVIMILSLVLVVAIFSRITGKVGIQI